MDYSELPKELESKKTFAGFVESNKLVIGIGLLVICIGLGVILLWRENYWKPNQEAKITSLEARVYRLEGESKNKVYIPLAGTQTESVTQQSSTQPEVNQDQGSVKSAATTKKTEPQAVPGKVSLNSATVEQLDSLPGIGPTYAKRIIEYRNANGGFKAIEEIKNVKGIGDATFDKFKNLITL